MSGYHFSAKVVSFGRGQSAVHTSAYNNRTQLHQDREFKFTKDYKDRDGLLFSGIFAPKGAPDWAKDRGQLWNRAEAAERQANGQPARNLIVAFPHELNQLQREWMLKDFVREQFVRRGMIADVAMHAPHREGDQRNYHAHILLTMRKIDGQEFAKTKCRDWNSAKLLGQWREDWAERSARALERAGFPVEAERWRHGHKTLGEQRAAALARGDKEFAESLDRDPTMHKGAKATAMDRRGEANERMQSVRDVIARNGIRVERNALSIELAALREDLKTINAGRAPDDPEWTDQATMTAQERAAFRYMKMKEQRGRIGGSDYRKERDFGERDLRPDREDDRER